MMWYAVGNPCPLSNKWPNPKSNSNQCGFVDCRYVMIFPNNPTTSNKTPNWMNDRWAHSTWPPEVRESLAGCLLLIRPCAAPASYIRLGKLHLGPAAEFPHSARQGPGHNVGWPFKKTWNILKHSCDWSLNMSCNMPKISKHGRFPIIVFELRAGVHMKSLSVRSFHALLEAFASLSAVRNQNFNMPVHQVMKNNCGLHT